MAFPTTTVSVSDLDQGTEQTHFALTDTAGQTTHANKQSHHF
jgi:hypothetical protein